MDEFGVLVESIGFKTHGRSAPMAELKNKPKSNFTADSSIGEASSVDSFSLPVEELDGIFRSNYDANKTRESQNSFGGDDIFGGPVPSSNQYGGIDLESMLNSSIQNKGSGNSNLTNSIGPNAYVDLLGLESKHGDPVGGSFDGFEVHSSGKQETKGSGFEDLIPGFGGASPSNQGEISKTDLPRESKGHSSKTRSTLEDDPFLVFETRVSQSDATWSYVGPSEEEISKGSVQSALDELDDFAMGDGHIGAETDVKRATSNKASRGTASNESENVDNLDEFFSGGARQNDAARSTSTKDSQFDIFFHEEKGPEGKQTSSWSSCSTKKVSSTTNMGDDFTALFGDVTTSTGEFHEINGEPEERRKARLDRHIRTNARIAEALAEKNQRDLQNQQEQEEKRRLAETVDSDIRRWAAGKEGNMRALLSSLHQVLWPECGWRPVTLTDMITSDSVKKVYKKATLCVHPDKVQQKGANLQQKYVAEKVFDLLKEAWKKFGAEELR